MLACPSSPSWPALVPQRRLHSAPGRPRNLLHKVPELDMLLDVAHMTPFKAKDLSKLKLKRQNTAVCEYTHTHAHQSPELTGNKLKLTTYNK